MVAERQARLFPWVPAQKRPNHSCRHFQRQAPAAEDSVQAERLAEPTRGRIVTLSSRLGRAHTTQHQGQSLVVVKPPRCRTWLGSARYASWIALLSAVAALELLAAAAPARVV